MQTDQLVWHPRVSYIVSIHNRLDLLRRSIETIRGQDYSGDIQLILVNDRSGTDVKVYIQQLAFLAQENPNQGIRRPGILGGPLTVTGLNLEDVDDLSVDIKRNHTHGYNHALRQVSGDICIFSHPEVMFPENAFSSLVHYHSQTPPNETWFVTLKPFWFTREAQKLIDSVDWRADVHRLEQIPGFFDNPHWQGQDESKGWNRDMRDREDWESTTCFSYRSDVIKGSALKGFKEWATWGPDDPWELSRRTFFGIKTAVVMGTECYHQFHETSQVAFDLQQTRVTSPEDAMGSYIP